MIVTLPLSLKKVNKEQSSSLSDYESKKGIITTLMCKVMV